ncbi:fibronectin type III domain-containing protein [Patescibacteria group bacterium]|nr:fibronectin type III domain-containing protein [Patescibacteria group bacterium]
MKKIILTILFLLFSLIIIAANSPVKANGSLVIIDEFVPYPTSGDEEWIELLNPDQDSALSLSGWRFVIYQGTEPNYTYYYSQDLSGSVPREGLLTFTTDNNARIPNEGACLVLFISDTESVFAVKYGNGTCDSGAGEQDASGVSIEQGKSIYYNLNEQTWNSASSPTRGWCNPGTGDCPTVATIVNQMGTEDVSTNLGDQTDFSRISELYFQKSEDGEDIGRITFLSEMNFTDRDALTWMQNLDSKLNISQGIISLDADLIKNLTDTQASLTMYNITLNNPKILVDGQEDSAGIVSGLTYDQNAHSLTFTAAHFTTFTAVENTDSNTDSSSTNGPPGCSDWLPLSTPHLFQIDTTHNSATLYFTPISDYLSYYFIAYGYEKGDWRFGTQFNSTQKSGVVSHTINNLAPNTVYYFTVRAGNGCAPGKWSNYLSAKTEKTSSQVKTTSLETEETEVTKPTPTPQATLQPETTNAMQQNQAHLPEQETGENLSLWQKILNFFKNLF